MKEWSSDLICKTHWGKLCIFQMGETTYFLGRVTSEREQKSDSTKYKTITFFKTDFGKKGKIDSTFG